MTTNVRRWRWGSSGALALAGISLAVYALQGTAQAQPLARPRTLAGPPVAATAPCTGKAVLLSVPDTGAGQAKGETTAAGGALDIPVSSLSFGLSSPSQVAGTGAGAGKATFSAISMVLPSSTTTLALYSAALLGHHLPVVTLDYVTSNTRGAAQLCREISLGQAMVTSFQESISSNGGGAADALSLDFQTIKISDLGQPAGSTALTSVGWDRVKNTGL